MFVVFADGNLSRFTCKKANTIPISLAQVLTIQQIAVGWNLEPLWH